PPALLRCAYSLGSAGFRARGGAPHLHVRFLDLLSICLPPLHGSCAKQLPCALNPIASHSGSWGAREAMLPSEGLRPPRVPDPDSPKRQPWRRAATRRAAPRVVVLRLVPLLEREDHHAPHHSQYSVG